MENYEWPWSRIQATEQAANAVSWIAQDRRRRYHNLSHIEQMYHWLDSNKVEYDVCLDWAVLLHDVIWDEFPDRELRSAVWARNSLEGVLTKEQTVRVCDMIMSTVHHEVAKPEFSTLIRADLHALADLTQCIANYALLAQEANEVLGLDIHAYATASASYMEQLELRIMHNLHYHDSEHAEFYSKVTKGIDLTIQISRGVLK